MAVQDNGWLLLLLNGVLLQRGGRSDVPLHGDTPVYLGSSVTKYLPVNSDKFDKNLVAVGAKEIFFYF